MCSVSRRFSDGKTAAGANSLIANCRVQSGRAARYFPLNQFDISVVRNLRGREYCTVQEIIGDKLLGE